MANNPKRVSSAVTIRDVASKAEVSVGTVSRVLNNHANVEKELKQRVLGAADALGYVPRQRTTSGSAVRQGFGRPASVEQLTHIAFCCRVGTGTSAGPLQNPYFSMILNGAEAECRQHNLHVLYHVFDDLPSASIDIRERLTRSQANALVMLNFTNHALISGLIKMNLPMVLVDHYFPDLPVDVVMNENYFSAIQAIQYLLEKGHRRIGFLDGLNHYTIRRRREGYRAALEEANLYDPQLVVRGNLSFDSGLSAADEVIERKLDCTAFLCANDSSAIGFIQRLTARGRRVPEDISVIGFDDIESSALISPPLTSLRSHAEQLGRIAVHRLLDRIKNPTLPVSQTLINSSLIERQSVKALSANR